MPNETGTSSLCKVITVKSFQTTYVRRACNVLSPLGVQRPRALLSELFNGTVCWNGSADPTRADTHLLSKTPHHTKL